MARSISDTDTNVNRQLPQDTSMAVNATRGLMVLILVFIHWSPGLFERLGIDYQYYTNPLFRVATPGFAIIFGLGMGLYGFEKYKTDLKTALKRTQISLRLLLFGVLLLALIHYLNIIASNDTFGSNWPTKLFYSVLLYYILAVASTPLWFKIITFFRFPSVAALLGATLFYVTQEIIEYFLPTSAPLTGFARLGGLLLEANYNYFTMSGTTFMGISLGLYIKRMLSNNQSPAKLLGPGVVLIALGIITSIILGKSHLWYTSLVATIWMCISYFGVVVVIVSLTTKYSLTTRKNYVTQYIFRLVTVIGTFSLHVYVAHSLVIPLKDLLITLGLSYGPSISIAMMLFILVIGIPVQRRYNDKFRT